MKGKLSILLLSIMGLFNAQTQKVGINQENPQFDVDVKGTMKIGDVSGAISDNSSPLGWNPANNQVVKLAESEKPFYRLEYRLRLNKAGKGSIKDLNTYIDANKYTAIVTQSTLTMEHTATSSQDDEQTALVGLLSQYGEGKNKLTAHVWLPLLKWAVGRVGPKDQNESLNNTPASDWQRDWNRRNHEMLSTMPQADVRVYSKRVAGEEKPTLHLSAEYPKTYLVTGGTPNNFIWYISLLIINKKLVAEGGNQTFNF